MNTLYTLIGDISYRDVIDIILVSIFFYYILLAIKGTKAAQILQGLVALIVMLGIAYFTQMHTLTYLLNGILVSTMVALPVVFQPEIRRTLMRVGQQGIPTPTALKNLDKEQLLSLVEEVSYAAFNLSLARFGALIVIEQDTGLQEVIETGQPLKAVISAKLLQTIFQPKTPLHDGAVIIKGNLIESAACYLPLTDSVVDARFGTRHRAAIGITEQSDCVVVVVSEETGEIRIAREGVFSVPFVEESQVRKALTKVIVTDLNRETLRGQGKITEVDMRSPEKA